VVGRQIDGVDAGFGEGGVVNGRGHRVHDRAADDAVDAGGGLDGIPAVEVLEVVDGDLAGGGRGVGGEGGEGEEAAELFGEHARDQPGLAHAEGDGGLDAGLQDFESFEVVADGAGQPDDFRYVGQALVEFHDEI